MSKLLSFLCTFAMIHLSGAQCSKWYTVKSGDYCWKIWTDNGLTEQQFYALNPGINCNSLQIGQSICVGGTAQAQTTAKTVTITCGAYYMVVSGDTCWKIWTSNGLTEQQFYSLNPGINCGALQIGQKVCVAAGSRTIAPSFTTKSMSNTTIPPPNSATRIVGYYATWSARPFSATQAQLLTHVIVAFPTMSADGSLRFDDGGQKISQVRQVASGYPNLMVMFAVGGGGNSQYLSSVVANTNTANTLISNIMNIIDTYDLDGVDIDWENPLSAADKSNYVSFMQKLRSSLNQHRAAKNRDSKYLLSFAGAPGKWALDPGYDLPGLLTYVDFVNVMTYDYYGSWSAYTGPPSPLYGAGALNNELNLDWTLNYYTCKTNQPSKLNLGIPFYGYYWTNVGNMAENDPMYRVAGSGYTSDAIAWKDIPSGWNLASAQFHNDAKVPYIYDASAQRYLGFENPQSISYKGQYAEQKNIGGLMIWALDHDDDQFKMLKAVNQAAIGLKQSNVAKYSC